MLNLTKEQTKLKEKIVEDFVESAHGKGPHTREIIDVLMCSEDTQVRKSISVGAICKDLSKKNFICLVFAIRDNSEVDSEENQLPEALNALNDKLDIFEREQMDKKKIETFEISKQRLLALKTSIESQLINDPQLIGCIPGVENQENLAFDCWINKYKHVIKSDDAIKNELDTFIQQIAILKTEMPEWNLFVNKWKLSRILFGDDFQKIWNMVKTELNICSSATVPNSNVLSDNDQHALEESTDMIAL